jgi:hypothetical protein
MLVRVWSLLEDSFPGLAFAFDMVKRLICSVGNTDATAHLYMSRTHELWILLTKVQRLTNQAVTTGWSLREVHFCPRSLHTQHNSGHLKTQPEVQPGNLTPWRNNYFSLQAGVHLQNTKLLDFQEHSPPSREGIYFLSLLKNSNSSGLS